MNMIKKLTLLIIVLYAGVGHAAPVMVDTAWLKQHMNDDNVVLVDMSGDPQYQRFHIPGAIYLGYDNLVETRKKDKVSVRIPDERLYKILGLLGISRDSHVVIYDDMGGLHAGRLYWELERIGHPKVSVVDGGLVTWVLAGNKVDNKEVMPKRVNYVAGKETAKNEIDLAGIKKVSGSGQSTLLDVRTKEEYLGHPKYKRSGHIPGARLWPWDDNVAFDSGFVLKSADELQQSLTKLGVKNKKDPLVLYCQSGHRASQAYLTLKHLGYEDIKLYDGSMAEYTQDKSAPVKQGDKP